MREPFHQLYFHLVWATYDREPLIRPSDEARLFGAMVSKTEELRCKVVAFGGVEDHVHLLVRVRPVVAVAGLVQEIKGASSHLMNAEIERADKFRWQGAYGAFTVSPRAVPAVKRYVRSQKEHHRAGTLHDEWEQCFIDETEEF